MGNYTTFSLSVEGSGPVYDKLIREQDKITFGEGYGFILGEWLSKNYSYNAKWYEWDKDMLTLSSKWPNVLFVLNGYGENPGNVWKSWFRNGYMHKMDAEIVFETFKPNLDDYLPYDHELDKRLAGQYKQELADEIAKLQSQLDSLA